MELRAEDRPVPSRPPREQKPSPHARHSRLVSRLKIVFPLLALALVVLVAMWSHISREIDGFRISFADVPPQMAQTLSMVNARFYGTDRQNRPYSVTADSAVQEDAQAGIVLLEKPKADFATREGAGVYMEADRGTFFQPQQVLELEGRVVLFHDQGYEIHTETARIDLSHSLVEGDTPITGLGPQGELHGSAFRILDNGKNLMIMGHSNATFKGAGKK